MKVAAAPASYHFISTPQNLNFSSSFSNYRPISSSPNPIISKSPSNARCPIRAETEIRVCVNRSCSRLGSRQTLELLSNLAPPEVSVNSCGCLGQCGAGPNLVVLPDAVYVRHCGTAARAAEVLAEVCRGSGGFDASKNLAALALRKRGEGELEKGNLSEAEVLLSQGQEIAENKFGYYGPSRNDPNPFYHCHANGQQKTNQQWLMAIDLKPSGGLHIIYKCRSSARLALGNNFGALEDAEEASRIAPRYPQAYISQGDAFLAMEECEAAEKAYSSALLIDPSIRRAKSFKARVAKLQEKLAMANASL